MLRILQQYFVLLKEIPVHISVISQSVFPAARRARGIHSEKSLKYEQVFPENKTKYLFYYSVSWLKTTIHGYVQGIRIGVFPYTERKELPGREYGFIFIGRNHGNSQLECRKYVDGIIMWHICIMYEFAVSYARACQPIIYLLIPPRSVNKIILNYI